MSRLIHYWYIESLGSIHLIPLTEWTTLKEDFKMEKTGKMSKEEMLKMAEKQAKELLEEHPLRDKINPLTSAKEIMEVIDDYRIKVSDDDRTMSIMWWAIAKTWGEDKEFWANDLSCRWNPEMTDSLGFIEDYESSIKEACILCLSFAEEVRR